MTPENPTRPSWIDRHVPECPPDVDAEDDLLSEGARLAWKGASMVCGAVVLVAVGMIAKGCVS